MNEWRENLLAQVPLLLKYLAGQVSTHSPFRSLKEESQVEQEVADSQAAQLAEQASQTPLLLKVPLGQAATHAFALKK